jgi:hypothetical protein
MTRGFMSFKIRRELVAVAGRSANKAVKRASQIAGRSKAQLESFNVVRSVPPVLGKKYVAAIRRNFRRANAKYGISPR